MVDVFKLEQRIKNEGLKYGHLAQQLGVSSNTFTKKMKGMVDFKAPELKILRDVLHMSSDDVDSIFFADDLPIRQNA